MIRKALFLSISLLGTLSIFANVKMPQIFGDNMVLQRDRPVAIWGWADPGEKIAVSLDGQTVSAKADKKGYWLLHLPSHAAGGPFQLQIKGKNTLTLSDIMIGEVWICSGQSNMEMPIAGWGKINNYEQEIAAANYSAIRHFKVPNTVATSPKTDLSGGSWKVCSPATAGDFSATAFFFARELYRKLQVPIGLINTSWGGTHVETWTSRGAFEKSDEFKDMIATLPTPEKFEEAGSAKKNKLTQTIDKLQGGIPDAAEADHYNAADLDDSKWPHIKLPGTWETAGLGLEDLDGIVWLRKTIEVAPEDAGKAATLDVDKIDDADETYVNGVKVGATRDYAALRHYTIPAGVLHAGKNTIAVRVEDTGGGGGVYGEASDLTLTIGGKHLPLEGDWSFKVVKVTISDILGPNSAPTLLYNAMINPLIPYTFQGAIWYQGESNAGRAYQYRTAFPLMISDWRQKWGQDFPFYFVQLSSWDAAGGNSEHGSSWAELREAQSLTLSLPKTGMAVTTDIGNAKDIHPKDKQDVGIRLAEIALANTYGQSIEYSGPVYQSMTVEGNKAVLSFTHVGGGMTAHDKYGYLRGFEVAGQDGVFHYAKAAIENGKVVVWQDDVAAPVAVRYGWADFAEDANLYNKDGLPASPFRTDKWKGITETTKYVIGR